MARVTITVCVVVILEFGRTYVQAGLGELRF